MDFDKICTMFTMQEPYYGILLSSMERISVPPLRCKTLAVAKNGNVFRLLYNKAFVDTLDLSTSMELLKHEICHIAFNHFSIFEDEAKTQNERKIRNVACDLEVNSYLNKKNIHDIELIYASDYGWMEQEGTLEYYKRLTRQAEQQKKTSQEQPKKQCNGGSGNADSGDNCVKGSQQENQPVVEKTVEQQTDEVFTDEFTEQFTEFDDHSQWPTGKEELQAAEQMIEDMVIAAAEEVEKSCGEIPAGMKGRVEAIRNKRKPKPVADWKRFVRRYLGYEFSEFIKKSKKRKSYRFPDAAGNKHRRKSHILVGIDTSGSIAMKEYLEFFGQIKTLTSTATFDVVECDAAIQNIYRFRNKPNLEVHGGGGTAFYPVIDYFLGHQKQYDALIYFTDGYGTVPANTPKDTLWVISSKGKKDDSRFKVNGAKIVHIPAKN